MYRTLFPGDLFADLDRLQRQLLRYSGPSTSIRGFGRGGFPALNVGTTPTSVEIYAFAPGLDPARIDLSIERGVLTLSGERSNDLPKEGEKATAHINERLSGSFRRVVSLPDDIDPDAVEARYRDGVLRIDLPKREPGRPGSVHVKVD